MLGLNQVQNNIGSGHYVSLVHTWHFTHIQSRQRQIAHPPQAAGSGLVQHASCTLSLLPSHHTSDSLEVRVLIKWSQSMAHPAWLISDNGKRTSVSSSEACLWLKLCIRA